MGWRRGWSCRARSPPAAAAAHAHGDGDDDRGGVAAFAATSSAVAAVDDAASDENAMLGAKVRGGASVYSRTGARAPAATAPARTLEQREPR